MADKAEEIAGYEARLQEALARIEAGLGKIEAGSVPVAEPGLPLDAPATAELETLRKELEEERAASSQLQARVRQIRRKQDERVTKLEAELADAKERYDSVVKEAAKMRRSEEGMRQALADMQSAARDGGIDAHLINRAMMAELEALRTERSADAREISDIIAAIEPLVEQEA
ncbi:MAG: hypothetical protein AAF618_08595 [Pseudomonadota bacterium]